MSEDTQEKNNVEEQTAAPEASSEVKAETAKKDDTSASSKPRARREFKKNTRRSRSRGRDQARSKPDFEQRIIGIRRVTRVVAGGRRFSFSVAMVIGDRKGSFGVGLGKATDTALAIQKAVNDAKKNMVKLNLTKEGSIPFQLSAKYASSEVVMFPAPGRGFVSGSSVRDVIELAGIKDISSKLLTRSKNKINNARVAIEALEPLVAARGISVARRSSQKSNDRSPRRAPKREAVKV